MVYGIGYCSKEVKGYADIKDKCFLTWRNMLKRCYSKESKYDNYKEQGVVVCEEWHDFYVFEKWYKRNYYEISGENMQLDKDILNKGNNVYSPENCVFVPQAINRLYVRDKRHRGNLPIGVSYCASRKSYVSDCSVRGVNVKHYHKDIESAFKKYKEIKEKYVRECAKEYKESIPEKVYNAMIMFNVEIGD